MKKFLTYLLCLGLLTGCGGNTDEPSDNSSNSIETNQTEANKEESKEENKEKNDEENDEENQKLSVSIDEQVIVDQDGIIVTAKELKNDSFSELTFLIENNTDRNIIVQTEDVVVNGFMNEPLMSCNVASGKKANDQMTLNETSLENAGIEAIKEISFKLKFLTDEFERLFITDTITIKTKGAESYTQEYDESGNVLIDQDGIKIIEQGLTKEKNGVLLYIKNESGRKITIQSRDGSVNDFMCEPIFSSTVVDGARAVDDIYFFDLEINGIEKIEKFEHSFLIFDFDTNETLLESEPIVMTFE